MGFTPKHFTVWTEIPARDLDRAIEFYKTVFQIDLARDESGPNPMATFPVADLNDGIAGHVYLGEPASNGAGPTVHFAVPDRLEDALARVSPAGGSVASEIIGMPFGRFAYAIDSEGNSIGLFSPAKTDD